MKQYILLLLLAIVFSVLYADAFDSKLDLNGDNVRYMQLAQNISQGVGFNNITPAGVVPESHFPPGYPFFLSVFMTMGINNLVFFKILNGILLLASLILLFYLVRKLTDNVSLAFAVTLLPAFSPHLLHFSGMAMSEMLFLFLSTLCLFGLYKYSAGNTKSFWKNPWFYVAIASAGASYYVRAVGFATIFAVIVFFFFRKEWKQAAVSVVGCILIIAPWMIRSRGMGGRYTDAILAVNHWRPEEGTISTVGDLVKKLWQNFDDAFIKGCKEILFPFMSVDYGAGSDVLGIAGGLLIWGLILYGAWNLGKLRWAFIAYIIGNVGMVILGTGGNGSRYVIPIAPLLFVCFYIGIYSILKQFVFKKENKIAVHFPYAFLIMALFMFPAVKAQTAVSKQPYPKSYQNYFSIAKELQKQDVQGKICCCRKTELFSYYAPKLFTINYLYSTEPKEVIQHMVDNKVDFVVLEQLGYGSTYRYLYPTIQQYPQFFVPVWHLQDPDTYLFRFELQKAKEELGLGS